MLQILLYNSLFESLEFTTCILLPCHLTCPNSSATSIVIFLLFDFLFSYLLSPSLALTSWVSCWEALWLATTRKNNNKNINNWKIKIGLCIKQRTCESLCRYQENSQNARRLDGCFMRPNLEPKHCFTKFAPERFKSELPVQNPRWAVVGIGKISVVFAEDVG